MRPIVLTVVPVYSYHQQDRIITFIERQLCFFELGTPSPAVDKPVQVMITRCLYHKDKESRLDPTRVLAMIVKPVSSDLILVPHQGFERDPQNRVLANAVDAHGVAIQLSPGRPRAAYVDNSNPDHFTPPVPGHAWVPRTEFFRPEGSRVIRIEGLNDPNDAEYGPYIRRADSTERAAA